MVKTTELKKIAENERIIVEYYDFGGIHQGVYIRDNELNIIGIDTNLTPTEERCVLAEEIGHHFTLPMGMDLRESHRYGILKKRILYETLAREYAAQLLIPQNQWEKTIAKKDVTVEEIMTTYDVTREMVYYRLDIHFRGRIVLDSKKYMCEIPEDRYEEELNILEAWLSGCEEQVSPMIQVA